MPLEDLDLEIEDEEELKKKKSAETVQVDVDLEFGATEKPAPAPSVAVEKAAPAAVETAAPKVEKSQTDPSIKVAPPAAGGQVKKLDEMRAKIAQAKGQAPAKVATAPATAATPMISGANALQMSADIEGLNLAQLSQMIEDTKFDAQVQVAVAEQKAVFMAEMLSDAKLLQHQIQQLLVRLNKKHADNKPELMAIQKALADFLEKKRK